MAVKFVTNIDLVQNQIVNGRFETLASDPAVDNFEGRLIYNSTEDTIKVYSGAAWRKMLHSVAASGSYATALTISEANGAVTVTPNLASGSIAGLLTSTDFTKLADATSSATPSKLIIRDSNGNADVAAPTADAHIATKAYVDAARSGLDVKASVRAATTAPITIATGLENLDVIDGVTLATGDRVLVKDQSSGAENGIYVVVASGAASRSTDADSNAEVTAGFFTFVEEGTTNGDSGWVLTTDAPIVVGTTALSFVQFSGAGQITAGAGLTKTGNTIDAVGTANRITVNANDIDIASTYVGQTSITTLGTIATGVWEGTTVAVNKGGTGQTSFTDNGILYGNVGAALDVTAAGTQYQSLQAGAAGVPVFGAVNLGQAAAITGTLPLGNGGTNATTAVGSRGTLAADGTQGAGVSAPTLARVVVKTLGNATDTVFTAIHGFNSLALTVQVFEVSTGDTVIADTQRTDVNTVTITFSAAPSSGQYKVVIMG